jgi:5-formyltetrahydrofolate cyclo-ligase
MRARLRRVERAAAERASRAALAHLVGTDAYRRSLRLVLYAELPDELPVTPLVERARADGKAILWPRLQPDGGLAFAACSRVEQLVPGRYGVREPDPAMPDATLGPDVLLLVPGLAFDERGARLGRGGGAWDRALAGARAALACGVAYELQIVAAVPREAHDEVVAALVTERGFRRCGGP